MRSVVTLLAIVLLCLARAAPAVQAFDVLIRNGRIMDGTGSPWYSGDIGIRNGRIAAIGRLQGATANTVIDAQNRPVTPGFENPNQLSVGIQYLLVKGVAVIAG